MWQYFLHCNQNTVCMTKCSGIDFMELSFLVVNFVMYISGPELERFLLWTPLKYQSLRRCYRCGASFGGAILLQVSIILLANGKINVLSERREAIKHRPTRNIPEFILFTYLLTKCEQSPSWEANRSSGTQEIPRIFWYPEVHYSIYKCLFPVPILIQIKPAYAPIPRPEDPF